MIDPTQSSADVFCDVCGGATRTPGYGQQFGTLQARWGYGSAHDGERYHVRLCEACFFRHWRACAKSGESPAYLMKRQRRMIRSLGGSRVMIFGVSRNGLTPRQGASTTARLFGTTQDACHDRTV